MHLVDAKALLPRQATMVQIDQRPTLEHKCIDLSSTSADVVTGSRESYTGSPLASYAAGKMTRYSGLKICTVPSGSRTRASRTVAVYGTGRVTTIYASSPIPRYGRGEWTYRLPEFGGDPSRLRLSTARPGFQARTQQTREPLQPPIHRTALRPIQARQRRHSQVRGGRSISRHRRPVNDYRCTPRRMALNK